MSMDICIALKKIRLFFVQVDIIEIYFNQIYGKNMGKEVALRH